MSLDPMRRAAILDAVGAWLDAHADEAAPGGVDALLAADDAADDGHGADLAALVGAVVACRHDVKLQTKVLKRVDERVDAAVGALDRARDAAEREARAATAALIELFDRLRRCATAVGTGAEGLPWVVPRERVRRRFDGIAEGVTLTLERARELLAEQSVDVDDPTGRVFDPRRMRAVGHGAATAQIAAGHVLETLRVGLVRRGSGEAGDEVLRPAEVRVARDGSGANP